MCMLSRFIELQGSNWGEWKGNFYFEAVLVMINWAPSRDKMITIMFNCPITLWSSQCYEETIMNNQSSLPISLTIFCETRAMINEQMGKWSTDFAGFLTILGETNGSNQNIRKTITRPCKNYQCTPNAKTIMQSNC